MLRMPLLFLFLGLFLGVPTNAFVVQKGTYRWRTVSGRTTDRIARSATIYAPSSWDGDGFSIGTEQLEGSQFFDKSSSLYSDLADLISKESVAALARLAVAFSPRGHQLDLRQIEHVEVLHVDENHMDIEAVVCERDGCVTIAVPIPFPRPCMADGLNECVMSNLDELDLQASQVVRRIEWEEAHHEEVEAEQRQLRVLKSSDDLHFPEWWLFPASIRSDLRSECESIGKLLNDGEFASEVKALATQALAASSEHDDWTVELACVAAVCPAGLLLRAATKQILLFEESSRSEVLEIPIPFPAVSETTNDLQTAVLTTVSGASGFTD